jgi:hypothetical protein
MTGVFTKLRYAPEGGPRSTRKVWGKKGDPFNTMSKPSSSKFSPSIAYSMINLLRKLR